jgi:hypothetical protein
MRKLCIGVLALLASAFAFAAEDDISYSMGLKVWNHRYFSDVGGAATRSERVNAPVISGSIRYKNYSFTASSLINTTYAFPENRLSSTNASYAQRSDTDWAVGYTLWDRVTPILGNKVITSDDGPTATIPFLGLSGFLPINDQSNISGTLAYSNMARGIEGSTENANYSMFDLTYSRAVSPNTFVNIGWRRQNFSKSYTQLVEGIVAGVSFNF